MDLKDYNNGKLNLEGFIQRNEPISEEQFNKSFVLNNEFEVYTEKSIAEFQKALTSELVKGVVEVDDFKIAQSDLSKLRRVEFMKGDTVVGVYVKEKATKTDDLEKGMVTDTFGSYSNNKMTFNKTGKEIATQITTILLPLLEAQKIAFQNEMVEISKDITIEPDTNVSEYQYKGFYKVLPKVGRYSYQCCESKWDSVSQSYGKLSEEQMNCQKYNQAAESLVSTMADIQYATLLSRNVEATKKYELTSDQVLALQF